MTPANDATATPHLYTIRNVLSVGFHYLTAGALMAGSVMLGQPWAIGVAATLVGAISYASIKKSKDMLENKLKAHPESHPDSPNLGKIVKELYLKAGFKVDNFPVYDFKIDEKKQDKFSPFKSEVEDIFGNVGKTHNAMASHLGKPVILISEPLLKLLNEDEEKAVLAHEFAHAKAQHVLVGLPVALVRSTAAVTNGLSTLVGMFGAGWLGILSLIGSKIVTGITVGKMIGRDSYLLKKKDKKTPQEMIKTKNFVRNYKLMSKAIGTAVLTYFNPAYLGIFAAARGMNMLSAIVGGTYSRSNEYQADRGAVELGASPLAMITGLRKMELVQKRSTEAFFGGDIPKKGALTKAWARATATHPTIPQRVGRLEKIAKKKGYDADSIKTAVSGQLNVPHDNDIPYDVLKSMLKL